MGFISLYHLIIFVFFSASAAYVVGCYLHAKKKHKLDEYSTNPSKYLLAIAVICSYAAYSNFGVGYKNLSGKDVEVPGLGKVTYEHLFTERSLEGETMDDFAKRVAPRLRAYSDQNGYEACGVIASNSTGFSVVIGTNHGYMVCVNSSKFIESGYRHSGATIHSHGRQGRFRPSKTDQLLMAEIFYGQRANMVTVHGQDLNSFSHQDHRSGPGYLAGENGLVLFQGNGSTRVVK